MKSGWKYEVSFDLTTLMLSAIGIAAPAAADVGACPVFLQTTVPAGDAPAWIRAAHLSPGGPLNVVVANHFGRTVDAFSWAGGTLLRSTLCSVEAALSLAEGDFDEDGYPDIAVTEFRVDGDVLVLR